jgi:nitrate/nitrite transport system permease protein
MSKQQTVPMIFNQVKQINWPTLNQFLSASALPIVGIVIFLGLWSLMAKNIDTSLGQFQGCADGQGRQVLCSSR